MKTYYDILEVSKFASSEVITRAYKVLVRKYHPDLQPDDKKAEAEKKLVEINKAYEVLSDENKKANYDKKLNIQNLNNETNQENKVENNVQKDRSSYNYNSNHSSSSNVKSNRNSRKNVNTNAKTNNQTNNNLKHNSTNESNEDYLYRQKLIEEEALKAQQEIYEQKAKIINKMQEDYYDSLRRMGYTIVEPFSWRQFFTKVITFIVLFIVILIITRVDFIYNLIYNNLKDAEPLGTIFKAIRSFLGGQV